MGSHGSQTQTTFYFSLVTTNNVATTCCPQSPSDLTRNIQGHQHTTGCQQQVWRLVKNFMVWFLLRKITDLPAGQNSDPYWEDRLLFLSFITLWFSRKVRHVYWYSMSSIKHQRVKVSSFFSFTSSEFEAQSAPTFGGPHCKEVVLVDMELGSNLEY